MEMLSQIDIRKTLDWWSYIFIFVTSGLGVFLGAYLKEWGKNYASKENFEELKNQLTKTTELVEEVKSTVSERLWISQQVWVKKQESYESIFDLLFHVKKYVSHQVSEFDEWRYYDSFPGFNSNQVDQEHYAEWEREKKEYENKKEDPASKVEAEKLKIKYENSMSSLFRIIEIKSIYLDSSVGEIAENLRKELSSHHDYEGWDEHFERLKKETDSAIDKIKEISKKELQIVT